MVHDPDTQKTRADFEAHVQRAIREGRDGRAEIVRQLCALPLDKLASVPPSALAMIGPEGLAALAAQRPEFSGLAPKPAAALTSASMTEHARPALPRRRISPVAWLCATILFAATFYDRLAVIAAPQGSSSLPSTNASKWPRCLRLDPSTDGCVYRTGGHSLTLARAAVLLQLEPSDLAELNGHLAKSGSGPLPTGSLIVVLRDRTRLVGGRP